MKELIKIVLMVILLLGLFEVLGVEQDSITFGKMIAAGALLGLYSMIANIT